MENLINKLVSYAKPVIGIGVTAWTRTGPAFLLPNYSIVCLLETTDLESIRQKCRVRSLEKDFGINPEEVGKQNTSSILGQSKVYSWLKSLEEGASLVIYKSTKKTEKICQELGIRILTNPGDIANPFEDKKEFRVLGRKAGLRLIPGETLLIDDFNGEKYQYFKKKYGPKLVFQLPDYKVGGGIGTLFINSRDDWREFIAFVGRRRKEGKDLIWVNATKFIKGVNASISACATKHGVLCGLVQTQLIDIPEAKAFKGRSGVWCGHDWGCGRMFKSLKGLKVQEKAEKIAKTWGSFMHKKGYKGMFGIDLMIDENEEVWPVECNSRYTGGFPAYAMMQSVYNEVNFDVFHLLEHLEIDYDLDLDKTQKLYRQPKIGAHLVLRNQTRKWVAVQRTVKAGVYKWKMEDGRWKMEWQRQGFAMQDLRGKGEFCLVDRTPLKERVLYPGERLVRVLFKDKIAVSSSRLNDWASGVCKKIYESYELKVIPSRTKG